MCEPVEVKQEEESRNKNKMNAFDNREKPIFVVLKMCVWELWCYEILPKKLKI